MKNGDDRLPPYWDGQYSNTWRWNGDRRIGPNVTDYANDAPAGYTIPSFAQQQKLPPYWDGRYSDTWRWTGDRRIGPNVTEWMNDEPAGYRAYNVTLAQMQN